MSRTLGRLFVVSFVLLAPALAAAQSAITGVVRDTSGAVLPGVTVEASSEVLIERVRTVVTDSEGAYRLVDLRPGTYDLSFALPGFTSFKRSGLVLPAEFTATINAELRVGAIEESVTVTGESPVVDTTSAARTRVLDREAMDAIPTGRSIQGMAQLIVGISLNLPDTGGARAMQQTYMTTRGMTLANNTVLVDGLMVNGLQLDGGVQSYFNDAMNAEVSYQTSGVGADTSAGGVRLNMIPREGGNRFSGDIKYALRPGEWQSSNLTDRHIARGLNAGNATDRIVDVTGAIGGPILRDNLWFFSSARYFSVNNFIANTTFDDGSQGIDDQYVKSAMARVTWQISPRNKLSAYFDEIDKYRGHDMQSLEDPETASLQWFSPAYNTGVDQVDVHGEQQDAAGVRLLPQPRVLHQQLPGWRRAAAVHQRVVRGRLASGERPRWAQDGGDGREHAEPRTAQHAGLGLVHHRRPQLQGRLPVHLGRLPAHSGRERRLDPAVSQQQYARTVLGPRQRDHPQYAAQLRRAAEPRRRHLRAGFVEARIA